MSWPDEQPAKTRTGATSSAATWVLAPTVMPIARSILSALPCRVSDRGRMVVDKVDVIVDAGGVAVPWAANSECHVPALSVDA